MSCIGFRREVSKTIFLFFLQCFVIILLSGTIEGASDLKPHLLGKGLYCKDPDTGDFHPVNSTWSSTTFCGNYVCNVRLKKNITESSEEIMTAELEKESPDVVEEESKKVEVVDKIQSLSEEEEGKLEDLLGLSENSTNSENITSIREFLLSIDENELKALLEIYKLAYDMAKEMEEIGKLESPVDEMEKARLATSVIYDKIPLYQKIPTSGNTDLISNSYQNPYSYYYPYSLLQTDKDSASSASEDSPQEVHYQFTNLHENSVNSPTSKVTPESVSSVPSYSAAPQIYSRYYWNQATGQLTAIDSPVSEALPKTTTQYIQPNPDNNQYSSYYYTSPQTQQYPYYTQPQTNQHYTQTFYQQQQSLPNPQTPQNSVFHVNPYQNQGAQYNSQSSQPSPTINIPLFRKVPEPQTPCALKHQISQSQNLINPKLDGVYEKKLLESMTKQFKRASIDPEQLKALRGSLSKEEVSSDKKRNLRDLFGGLSKKSRVSSYSKLFKVDQLEDAALSDHNIAKREVTKQPRRNTKPKKEKPTSNEDVDTYVTVIKCNFESEPAYFRKGKDAEPYPLCCPQKIDEDDEE